MIYPSEFPSDIKNKQEEQVFNLLKKLAEEYDILSCGECELLPNAEEYDIISGENLLDLCPLL